VKHKMTKDEILKGIEAYREKQQYIISLIKKHDGELTEDQFDKEFGDCFDEILPNGDTVRHRKRPRIEIWPMEGNAFILGSMIQGDWGKWLHLTQFMLVAGILSVKENDQGKVVYGVK